MDFVSLPSSPESSFTGMPSPTNSEVSTNASKLGISFDNSVEMVSNALGSQLSFPEELNQGDGTVSMVPVRGPYNEIIDEHTVLIAAICCHVEVSSNPILNSYPPSSVTGEPGPEIDYAELQNFVKLGNPLPENVTALLKGLGICRLRYFSAYELYFTIVRGAESLCMELQSLNNRLEIMKNYPEEATRSPRAEVERRKYLNSKARAHTAQRYEVCCAGLAHCVKQLAEQKKKVMPLIDNFRRAYDDASMNNEFTDSGFVTGAQMADISG